MDRTIVPTNLLSWPRVKNLIPDHKLIVLGLWQNPFITPCGVYFIDLDMFSGMLGFNKVNVDQAISDFVAKGIIEFDFETSEVLICDWWRFHKCESPAQINMIQKAVDKVQSGRLKAEFFERIKHYSNKINDLRPNYNITQHNLTEQQLLPTTADESASCGCGSELKFPKALKEEYRSDVAILLVGRDDAQILLDELAAAIERSQIKNSPVLWLQAVIAKGVKRTEAGLAKTNFRKINYG